MSFLHRLIGFALVVLLVVPVLTAAIDCDNPRNHRERFVCANPDLLSLDKQLSSVYEKALAVTGMNRTDFQNVQRLWELDGGGCWDNVDCIKKRYNDRIAVLEGVGQSAQLHVDGGTATSPNSENSEPVPAVAANENSPLTTPSSDPQAVPTATGDDQHGQEQETTVGQDRQLENKTTGFIAPTEQRNETPSRNTGDSDNVWGIWLSILGLVVIVVVALIRFKPTVTPEHSPVEPPMLAFPLASLPQQTGKDLIRQRLRQFEFHAKAECIGCGYEGYMGLVKRTKPLHENGLFKLAAFMGGAARNWYAASAFMGGVAKNILQCPNCGARLEQEVGSRPTLMLFGGR